MNKHLSTIILVGRPNVGKSTLFNRLVGRRQAIEHPEVHTTRDLLRAVVQLENGALELVDTAGDSINHRDELVVAGQRQREKQLTAADLALMVFAAPEGLTGEDERIIRALRRRGQPFIVVAAKADNERLAAAAVQEGSRLGLKITAVSALHNLGLPALHSALLPYAHPYQSSVTTGLVILGRPNAGKSTLINALAGSEVSLVHPLPGTTRDVVSALLPEHNLTLYDTAGLVRRSRALAGLSRFATRRQEEALKVADVAVICVDGTLPPAAQDARLAQQALAAGAAVILAVTKWDKQADRSWSRDKWLESLYRRFHFAPWLPVVFISSLTNLNLNELIQQVKLAAAARRQQIPADRLEDWRRQLIQVDGRLAPLETLVQVSTAPPRLTATIKRPLAWHLQRQLVNRLRDQLLPGPIPIDVNWRLKDQPRKRTKSKNQPGKAGRASVR